MAEKQLILDIKKPCVDNAPPPAPLAQLGVARPNVQRHSQLAKRPDRDVGAGTNHHGWVGYYD